MSDSATLNEIVMKTSDVRPIELIINASSGRSDSSDREHELIKLFAEHGIEIQLKVAQNGEELLSFAKNAAEGEASTVIAGGGDGTISAVAGAIAGTDKHLGVLPLGTLNHFAKDLNIPSDLEGAIAVIASRHTVEIDVAEVNERIFINNSSLGLYPEMVRGRERRQRLGFGKWHSLARSALTVFRRYPLLATRLKADNKEIVTRTPFIFIGNNEYEIESFNIGAREHLDRGHLSVYMTRRMGRLALLRIALKGVFGGLSQEKDFLSVMTDEINVDTHRRRVRVALDGEVVMMATPLRYRIRPGALRVIVPEVQAAPEDAA